jgi:HEAT repeat protein
MMLLDRIFWSSLLSESNQPSVQNEPILGRFLVSFVVVPGTIVLVCLAIVVGIRWLTISETSAEQLVDTIERREGNVRWRATVHLAGMLADPEHAAIRRDHQLAGRLTDVLRRELESGGRRKEEVMLQTFLCRALGEFEVDTSLPVLVDATGSQRNTDVRRSAIEAIALLAGSLKAERVRAEPGLYDSLLAASRDGDPQVRLSAAYALGVLGGAQAEERLVALLSDDDALVRYNAATGLARRGNASAVDVLLEMLARNQQAAFGDGTPAPSQDAQPELVHVNALEALTQLIEANPDVPLDRIREAVADLSRATDSQAVQAKTGEVRELLATPEHRAWHVPEP